MNDFKPKKEEIYVRCEEEFFFMQSKVWHRNRLPREVVDAPHLKAFRALVIQFSG